jgi:hypothetical protein
VLAHCECLECLECLRIVREKMRVGCDGWVGCYICMQPAIAIAAVHVSAIAIAAVIFSDCYRCSHFFSDCYSRRGRFFIIVFC